METTTMRVRKSTHERLKKIASEEQISITDMVNILVDEHGRSFWKGINREAKAFLDKEEMEHRFY